MHAELKVALQCTSGGNTMNLLEVEQFLIQCSEELGWSDEWYKERIEGIQNTGEFHPTYDELVFGARVAWRNSNRCIGRLFWKSLQVFDERNLETEEEIYEALLRHIQFATNAGRIRPTITVFKSGSVCIWNEQLIRYAGYKTKDGIIGDPSSLVFTEVCQKLGWQGEGSHFDVLPLVIQVDNRKPVLFNIPKEYVLEIPIRHPQYERISELNLKWYAVPIIANFKLNIGGIEFEAAPFNGWYMGTEIGSRNFADINRYNLLPKVAEILELNTSTNSSLWKDYALLELNIAVLHSFKEEGVNIIDHHTAAQQFKLFEQQEAENNREVTGNWMWLIPPMSPATTHIYHKSFTNVIKKPNYFYQIAPYLLEKQTIETDLYK